MVVYAVAEVAAAVYAVAEAEAAVYAVAEAAAAVYAVAEVAAAVYAVAEAAAAVYAVAADGAEGVGAARDAAVWGREPAASGNASDAIPPNRAARRPGHLRPCFLKRRLDAPVAWAFGGLDELFPALPPPVCRLLVAPPPLPLSPRWATTLGLAGTTILGAVRCGGGCAGRSGVLGSRTSERGWSAPAHSFPAKVRVAPTATKQKYAWPPHARSIATAQDGPAESVTTVRREVPGRKDGAVRLHARGEARSPGLPSRLTPHAAARRSKLLQTTHRPLPRRIPTAPQGRPRRAEAPAVAVREGSTQPAPPRPR